jgi:hypothetical protein
MISPRSLAFIGEKTPTTSVSSIHATTHSYTIQPTITLDGKLLSPFFCVSKRQEDSLVHELNRVYLIVRMLLPFVHHLEK